MLGHQGYISPAIAALTGRRVTDSQTGFRALKKGVIDKMNLGSTGFEIESEITVKRARRKLESDRCASL
jgi:hypothetical protein